MKSVLTHDGFEEEKGHDAANGGLALNYAAENAEDDCSGSVDGQDEVGGEDGEEADTDEAGESEEEQRHGQKERGARLCNATVLVGVVLDWR